MNEPEIVRLKNSVSERDHALGSQSAPVTFLEYGNFECIHCGRAYPVIKEIIPRDVSGFLNGPKGSGAYWAGFIVVRMDSVKRRIALRERFR
jgi:hypothetical protein